MANTMDEESGLALLSSVEDAGGVSAVTFLILSLECIAVSLSSKSPLYSSLSFVKMFSVVGEPRAAARVIAGVVVVIPARDIVFMMLVTGTNGAVLRRKRLMSIDE